MDVSIIITTRNRKSELTNCIESIKRSDASDLKWELIVVDDSSNDGTKDLRLEDVAAFSGKMIHNASQQMMVKSRNIGAKEAKGRYLLFIDDDNIIDPSMIRNLVDFLDKDRSCGIAGPTMYYKNSGEKYMDGQRISFFTGKTTSFIDGSDKISSESDGIPNVFMIKKEVFDRIGYFEEDLLQTFTEPFFSLEAEKAGFHTMIVKTAKTFHNIIRTQKFEPESLGGNFPQKAYCVMRNRTILISRYGKIYHKIIYLLFFSWFWPLVYSLIVLRRRRFDLMKLYWCGFFDGLYYFFTGRIKNSIKDSIIRE